MTRKLLLSLSALSLALCASADPVTLGRAKSMAAQLLPNAAEARLVKAAGLSASQLQRAPLANSASRPYYIFSRGEGKGYVIVSGDDCLPTILGYTESGDYDETNTPPALAEWLDGYEQLVEQAQANGANAPRKATTATNREDIATLCQTHWHQSSPYNDQCPYLTGTTNRAITGCVATAASQVVFYYKSDLPNALQYDTPTYSYGDAPVTNVFKAGTPLKWDLMQNSYNSEPSEYKEAVATFVAALGAQTWLTYGSSTSGQISNLVYTFSHQFNLSSTCVYKSGYSQTAWEQLIYDDLAAGKPIVYSGVHASNGGHAVVLDGYQKSTGLFHFNFGWGGQGDGWYTVDDQTGMNGFSSQQGMVYNVTPTQPAMEAKLTLPKTLAAARANTIKASVTNKSKVASSGLMLFANTTGKEPTTGTAKATDNSSLAPGTTTLELSLKPTSVGTWYVFLTDKNRRVLAKDSVEAVEKDSHATLDGISVLASSESVKGDDGLAYPIVYNAKKVTATMNISNPSDVEFTTRVNVVLEASGNGGKTFVEVGRKSVKTGIPAGQSAPVEVALTDGIVTPMSTDSLYRLYLVSSTQAPYSDGTILNATADSMARFKLADASLAATLQDDGTLKYSGAWDATTYTTLAKRSANKKATAIDLTEVTGIGQVPAIDGKPNILAYVPDNTSATGDNLVTASGLCKSLRLTTGYDFTPSKAFKAEKVSVALSGYEPAAMRLFTAPATLDVPQGISARTIDSHNSQGIKNKTSYVEKLEAGKTYILMATSKGDTLLTGSNADVAIAPVANADTTVKGSFVATTLLTNGYYTLNPATNRFVQSAEGDEVEALGGYLLKNNSYSISTFTAYNNEGIDTLYIQLGQLIAEYEEAMQTYGDLVTAEATATMADSIASATAIYNGRTYTTRNKLNNYMDDLAELFAAYKRSLRPGLTGINEDFSALVTNPSFELGTSSTTLRGWTKGSSSSLRRQATSSLAYNGVGSEGSYLLVCTASSEDGTEVSQTVKGLLPGTYTLTAMVGTKDDYTVTLYAGNEETSVPAHEFGQYYLTEAKIEGIEVGADSTMTIGIKPCQWYKADAFKLYCTATAADPTGIESIRGAQPTQPLAIHMANGKLTLTASQPTPVTIANLQGITVWRQTINGTATVQLPKGLYIIGGKKVAVK